VLLTHSHLDHIAALPLMLDAVSSLRSRPVQVHALAATIAALQTHVFNNVIWPDFSAIPSAASPFLRYRAFGSGDLLSIAGVQIEVLPANHTVPAVGFAVQGDTGWWVFSGDTERNLPFWNRINALKVICLVIETAFSNRERDLARRSLHLSPEALAQELAHIPAGDRYPIYITHTKPSETSLIMDEIERLDHTASAFHSPHDIRWLSAGHTIQV